MQRKFIFSIFAFVLAMTGSTGQAWAKTADNTAETGFSFFDINVILLLLAIFLLIPILVLSRTLTAAARYHVQQRLKSSSPKALLVLVMLSTGSALFAQTSSPITTALSDNFMTILLLGVIAAELLLILFMARKTNDLIQKRTIAAADQAPATETGLLARLQTLWVSMNFKPLEEEHKLDTGHDYDGIRELDNVTPPWFTTAFIVSILFGAGYIYRYHIARSAPLQIEEYERSVTMAALKHEEYLSKQASNINESNIEMLMGAADLEAGKKVFNTLCAVCHRTDGGGLVGPNLTDQYWIHGGSIQDVFRTVKYGVPDKGMISWKEQLSPVQMAQVSSYILTLAGTNPADPKEPQGILYVPEVPAAGSDTTGVETL